MKSRRAICPFWHLVPGATACQTTLPLSQRPKSDSPLHTTPPFEEQAPVPDATPPLGAAAEADETGACVGLADPAGAVELAGVADAGAVGAVTVTKVRTVEVTASEGEATGAVETGTGETGTTADDAGAEDAGAGAEEAAGVAAAPPSPGPGV